MATADGISDELLRRLDFLRNELNPVFTDMGNVLLLHTHKQIGLVDHDLNDLRKMGHPYRMKDKGDLFGAGFATKGRDGKWRLGIKKLPRQIREGTLGHDLKLVHVQSKRLWNAVYMKVVATEHSIRVVVSVDLGAAPWAEWVIRGTRHMIPRDFLGIAAVKARSAMLAIVRVGMNDIGKQIGLK